MSVKRAIIDWMVRRLLSHSRLRKRIVHRLTLSHYDDMQISFTLGDQMVVPLKFNDSKASFSEVFLARSYDWIPPDWKISRWLDLGCNNGYFSLLLVDRGLRGKIGDMKAFLVDGDVRSRVSVEAIASSLPESAHLEFAHGVVGPKAEEVSFEFRRSMGSRIGSKGSSVRVLSQETLMAMFPPPYDLVKVDIEGAETLFLAHYVELLSHTDRLIIEWHSWNFDGIAIRDFENRIRQLGFEPFQRAPKRWVENGCEQACVDYSCVRRRDVN